MSQTELRALITAEAAALGLTFDEAVHAAHHDALPRNVIGTDILFLTRLLGS